jgi:hypothetical protein
MMIRKDTVLLNKFDDDKTLCYCTSLMMIRKDTVLLHKFDDDKKRHCALLLFKPDDGKDAILLTTACLMIILKKAELLCELRV